MNFKTTYILFGVLLGFLGIFLLTQIFAKRTADQQTYVVPGLHDIANPVKTDDVERIEIDRQRPKVEKLVFTKDEHGNWVSTEPSVRLDANAVKRSIDQVFNARRDQHADLVPDLKRFGLDNPAEVVTLTKKGGEKEWKLNIGDSSAGEDKALVYVTTSEEPKEPLAVSRSSLDTLFKPLNDFRTKTLLADSPFDISSVTLEAPKHDTLALEKASDGKWRFDKPAFGEADYEGETSPAPPGDASSKITGVRELLQTVQDLRVESDQDFATTGATDKELSEKGLEKGKEHLRVGAKRQPSSFGSTSEEKKEPIQDTLLIGNKADEKGEKYYARLESDHNIVKVPGKKVEALTKIIESPSVLRSHDLVQIDSNKVDAINVRLSDQETLKLRHTGEPAVWKIYDSGKVQDSDPSAVQKLLSDLTAKRQVKDFPAFAKTDAELGLDKPSTVVSLWVDGVKKEEKKDEKKDEPAKDDKKDDKAKDEKKEEKKNDKGKDDKKDAKSEPAKKEEKKDANAEPALKDDKPTVRLVFGKKDKDVVYVRREIGSETTRLAVPATLLDKVSEGKLAYLDRKLPSFNAPDVTKVALLRGNEAYEIEKPKEEKPKDDKTEKPKENMPAPAVWKVLQPKDLAGRNADPAKVEHLLDELRDLQAERLVAEKASDSEMDRYGLKAPSVKATLTERKSEKETKDQVYLFGKETDDKTGVYAKQGDRDMVFVVRKGVLDTLRADLQDTKIFAFDASKVKGLKLQGWQDIIGSPYTLDLDHQSQAWTVKAPADFKLNTNQVETFLAGLINIRAERFLGRQTAPKPEYKLELKDGALQVTLVVEGEKEPITLTVGGPSGADGLYATSTKFPGEVFILPKVPFEGAKSKPVYFKKE